MKKKDKIIIGIVGALLLPTITGFALKPWFKSKFGKKGSSRLILEGKQVVRNDITSIIKPMGGWSIVMTDGVEVCDYTNTGSMMSYPMTNSLLGKYDNVANLQAYLLFTNPDLELCIDGYFGDFTSEAVLSELNDITGYGYDGEDYDYETVTEAYYTEVILTELEYFKEQDKNLPD